MAGHVDTVCHFLNQGLNVNLDTYTCSPLHIAARYRRKAVVEMLLAHGANPNQRDHEQSTPLHALSCPNLCDCVSGWSYCDTEQPVDEIVTMLVNYGANIEARNSCGDTPLQLAVSRFDVELTKTLLKHGASPNSLNKDKMFRTNFSPLELKCYAFTLKIIEVMQLLQSSGYQMDLLSRVRMIKCWLNVRGNCTDYMICNNTGDDERDEHIFRQIVNQIYIYNEFGFYIEQTATNYLHQRCEELRPRMEGCWRGHYEPDSILIDGWRKEVAKIEGINITENVSLYKFCQMSYSKGYSIIKNVKNWHVLPMDDIKCSYLRIFIKRHIANVLIRPRLELLAADLLMTDYSKLNFPYTVCRNVVEHMSDEDLFYLFKKTNENDLEQSLSV